MEDNLYHHFSSLLNATKRKIDEKCFRKIDEEYDELEQVPPAPGQPNKQHAMMVGKSNYFTQIDKQQLLLYIYIYIYMEVANKTT